MKVLSKYRLELHWKSVEYSNDDTAVLKGAYFTGPVLKEAAKLNEEDQLILDMTEQHQILVPDFYQAVLKWEGVTYKDDKIFLKEASVKGKYVNSVEKLENDNFILIDCKQHDTKNYMPKQGKRIAPGVYMEQYNHPLVYWAEICKADKEKKF